MQQETEKAGDQKFGRHRSKLDCRAFSDDEDFRNYWKYGFIFSVFGMNFFIIINSCFVNWVQRFIKKLFECYLTFPTVCLIKKRLGLPTLPKKKTHNCLSSSLFVSFISKAKHILTKLCNMLSSILFFSSTVQTFRLQPFLSISLISSELWKKKYYMVLDSLRCKERKREVEREEEMSLLTKRTQDRSQYLLSFIFSLSFLTQRKKISSIPLKLFQRKDFNPVVHAVKWIWEGAVKFSTLKRKGSEGQNEVMRTSNYLPPTLLSGGPMVCFPNGLMRSARSLWQHWIYNINWILLNSTQRQ